MRDVKKYIFIIVIILVSLFSFNNKVRAITVKGKFFWEKEKFYVDAYVLGKDLATDTNLQNFVKKFCNVENIEALKSGSDCLFSTDGSNYESFYNIMTESDNSVGDYLKILGTKKLYFYKKNFSADSTKSDAFSKFKDKFYNEFIDNGGQADSINKLCTEKKILHGLVCDITKEHFGNANVQTDNSNGETIVTSASCTINYRSRNGKSTDSIMKISIDKNYKITEIRAVETNGTENGGVVDLENGDIMMGTMFFHFYSIDPDSSFKTWNDTKGEFEKRFKAAKVLENKECPDIEITFCGDDDTGYDQYIEFGSSCNSYVYKYQGSTSSTNGESNETFEKIEKNWFEEEIEEFLYHLTPTLNDEVASCSDIIGDDLGNMLHTAVNVGKIVVALVLIVLGVVDFASAIVAQDEGGIKKAQGKFIKRLLYAALFFLAPSIIRLLLTAASGIWPSISTDLCGIL